MEVGIPMATNSTVVTDEGDSPNAPEASNFSSGKAGAQESKKLTPGSASGPAASSARRESGDQVNRFLMCALVSESSKRIKASAEKAGEFLPMTMVVRRVLRSYRQAAADQYGPLSEPEPDIEGLRALNEKVLREGLASHSSDRVKNSETRLTQARQLGDDTKIKAEKEGLERAIELRDRLADEFR
jgi:hypothetical protein